MTGPAALVPAGAVLPADIDAVALEKLRELDPDGRRGVVQRVLTAFESSLARWLSQLEGQRGGGDPAIVSGIAHTLKSSAGSVGAKDLARACADVESRLRGSTAGSAGDGSEQAELAADVELLLGLGQRALVAIRAILRA